MAKKLIINAVEQREIRAAILDNGEPVNFFIERSEKKCQKGNIYKARVTSVESHLQAAFVELESGQHGFLSASDVLFPDGGISLYQATKAADKKLVGARKSGDDEAEEITIEAPLVEMEILPKVEDEIVIEPPVQQSEQTDANVDADEEETKLDDSSEESFIESIDGIKEEASSGEPVIVLPETGQDPVQPLLASTDNPVSESVQGDSGSDLINAMQGASTPEDRAEVAAEASEFDVDTALMGIEENPAKAAAGQERQSMRRKNTKIEDVLKVGQDLVVQIIKEGIGRKAPMVTTFLSLAGHYLVLTPGNDRSGISKQVRDQEERARLKSFLDKAKMPDHCGLIVRTAAVNVPIKDLQADLTQLRKKWRELAKDLKKQKGSGVLRREEGLLVRLVRDYFNSGVEEVVVDDPDAFEEIKTFFTGGMADRLSCLKLYEGEESIFTHYKLDESIRTLFRRTAPLAGGGSLIFDQCEAMLVIDVNSGTFREGVDDEDTAFRLNMIACKEIARQVQMRDVGGIIMVDFVDMRRSSNRNKVEKELERSFKGDKSKVNITHIGQLGVLEMSRQRTKDSLRNTLYSTCKACDGTGLVPSGQHTAMGILRLIREQLKANNKQSIKIYTTQAMVMEMLNRYKSDLLKLEEKMENADIQILVDDKLGVGEFTGSGRGKNQRNQQQHLHQGQHRQHSHGVQTGEEGGGRNRKRKRRGGRKDGRDGRDGRGGPDQQGGQGLSASRYVKPEGELPLGIIRSAKHETNVIPMTQHLGESTPVAASNVAPVHSEVVHSEHQPAHGEQSHGGQAAEGGERQGAAEGERNFNRHRRPFRGRGHDRQNGGHTPRQDGQGDHGQAPATGGEGEGSAQGSTSENGEKSGERRGRRRRRPRHRRSGGHGGGNGNGGAGESSGGPAPSGGGEGPAPT